MGTTEMVKNVYKFGNATAEGNGQMKKLLGGKGANLEEMSLIGIPVPPGFTVTTEVCLAYQNHGREMAIGQIRDEVLGGIKHIENLMGTTFGSAERPCLVSVRSGARVSMPGMMDTILNVGLNDDTVEGLAIMSGKEKFAWDTYRRFIQMYGSVVMKIKQFTKEGHDPFEKALAMLKEKRGFKTDQELTAPDLKNLVKTYKEIIYKYTNQHFPNDAHEQLWNSIIATFESWTTERAIIYRKLNAIPNNWGTAVNIQAMVYGNMGNKSASGVAFTRDAATGEDTFNGEYLIDAQGEDVVAGTRTPLQITLKASQNWAGITNISAQERQQKYPSLEEHMPQVYKELDEIQQKLEDHFVDMQDLEFTIQEGKLWLLQTRNAKRTGSAMIKIGMDLYKSGSINKETLITRMKPNKLNELLHPVFDNEAMANAKVLTRGLPASPGAASGQIVFFSEDAETWHEAGKHPIMVRTETSADDLKGMAVADGILTARGGMTSHAAVVARGMGKCCVAGAGEIKVNIKARTMTIGTDVYKEGDWISLNGSTGLVFEGKIITKDAQLSNDFDALMEIADNKATMKVRTNADTPAAAQIARTLGAQGIGLCRTEHMFFEGGRIKTMREMILAEDEAGRRKALNKLLPMQRSDFEGIFEAMQDLPVTIRLLDPPLHEFVPFDKANQQEMANEMGLPLEAIKDKVEHLREINPMLGHRGCRLGNTYPEITEMQARAIIEAALNLEAKGIKTYPEIMVPLTGTVNEMIMQERIIRSTVEKVFLERQVEIRYWVGTMIEIPRAALMADKIAQHADFFSFGTNDLTQMTYGFSRDDAGTFLPIYIDKGILKDNPFEVLDQEGVGQLVEMATIRGRNFNKTLKVGVCGEHGGEPKSVAYFNNQGLDYVSCSPYRVPIARLAAAQAAIKLLQ